MPYKRNLWHRALDAERQILRWTALAIIALGAALLAWFRWWPATVRPAAPIPAVTVESNLPRIQAAAARQPPAARLAWLERELAIHTSRLRALPASGQADEQTVLAWLEQALAAERATAAETASLAAESAADQFDRLGDAPSALASRREALRLQREANQLRPTNAPAALQRQAGLAAAIAHADYASRRAEIDRLLAEAESAADPTAARNALVLARQADRELGPVPAGLTLVPGTQFHEVEIRLATRFSTSLHRESLVLESAAQHASSEENFAAAAEHFRRAAQTQQAINDLHPEGVFADFPRARRLALLSSEAQAHPLLKNLAALDHSLTSAIRTADTATAITHLAHLSQLLAQLRSEHPDLSPRFDQLVNRIDFVSLHIADLGAIRDAIVSSSVPLPSPGHWRIQTTPIRQSVFARVNHDNPSRYTDPRLPVESVTLDEARRFCQRVGWLLGCEVRLPTSDEVSAPISTVGFSEWLQPTVEDSSTPVPEVRPDRSAQSAPSKSDFRSRRRTFRVVFQESGP